MDAYNCVEFNPTLIDLFLPSYKIIYKFCLSTDKTKLFFISLARLCFWSILTASLIKNDYIGQNDNAIVFLVLVAYILINLFYIIILIFKRPTIDKKVMDRISTDIVKEIKTKPLTLPTIIKQSP